MAASRVSELYRTALITGASTGLGRAFAEMLLAEGVLVWGTSREATRLAPLTAIGGGRFTPVALELGDAAALQQVFRSADQAAGGFDLVINNAGFGVFAEFSTPDFVHWQEQLDVMLLRPAQLTQLALRGMRTRRRGAIVNISSLALEYPLPFQSAYNMAKAGLSALSETLMLECAGTGIVILDVRPGDYRTDLDASMRRPQNEVAPPMRRVWAEFQKLMLSGPPPAHAADALRRALLSNRSMTLRTGRFFQAVLAPLITRLGSLALKRRIQARYYGLD
ncbi:MAG: SDR family oxidoreductase [Verrucomicrobiota bacterium]